jgi:hypothetical protein
MFRAGPVRMTRLRRLFSSSSTAGGSGSTDPIVPAGQNEDKPPVNGGSSKQANNSRVKYAMLYPSKTPIFPLQTFISSLKENDKQNLQRLSVKDVAACYIKSPEDEKFITSEIKDLIAESHQELTGLIEAEET